MACVKPVLLKGNITETLRFPLGKIESIQEGEWQLALLSVSFAYNSKEEHPDKIERKLIKVTSNYVMTQEINEQAEKVVVPAVLSVLEYGSFHGAKKTIGFKNQIFYSINNPEQDLVVKFSTVDTNFMLTGANVFLLLLIKRIR